MFGLSFSEVLVVGVVTLLAVGPQRLPGMLRSFGQWMRKLRQMTIDVRQQTGIDELLRQEGMHGGLAELRSLMRGQAPAPAAAPYRPPDDPYSQVDIDVTREYPPEGPDAQGALPDELLSETPLAALPEAPPEAPPAA